MAEEPVFVAPPAGLMERFMPRPAVYFPKFVCLNNPRLAVLYWLIGSSIMGVAVYQFLMKQQYLTYKEIRGEASFVSWKIRRPHEELLAINETLAPHCTYKPTDQKTFDYVFKAANYTNIHCSPLCINKASPECVSEHELYSIEDDGSLFIPTFFEQSTFINGALSPTTFHFVPAVEQARIAFSHRFAVSPPVSNVAGARQDATSDSSASEVSEEDKMLTVILKATGDISQNVDDGSVLDKTLEEMFDLTKLEEYSDTVSRLMLNEPYLRVDEDIIDDPSELGPTVRLTGVTLYIRLVYTNQGSCQMDSEHDVVSVKWKGNIACMSVRGVRNFVQRDTSTTFDVNGTSIMRLYQGVRVVFEQSGTFAYYDGYALFDGLTTILVWAQIPVFVIYYIIITILGSLSTIYSRVIHQSMSIQEACAGLAARLCGHSSAYFDVQEKGRGITKAIVEERIRMILGDTGELSEEDLMKFIDFIFKGMCSGGMEEGTANIVDIQGWSTACTENEPLDFDSLVKIFDKDRQLGTLERWFNDDTIRAVINEQFTAEDEEGEKEKQQRPPSQEPPQRPSIEMMLNGAWNHSCLEKVWHCHEEQKAMYNRVNAELEKTLGEAESALNTDDDHLYEIQRKEMAGQKPKAKAVTNLEGGATYLGEWIGTVRHGIGEQRDPDGTTYSGQWEAGRLHGVAVMRNPNGAKYDGQWVNGKQSGNGSEVVPDGSTYDGQFERGFKSGHGRFCMADGSIFDGEVVDNMMHGPGTYEWSNGQKYAGEWVNDKMHGHGTYTWPDQNKFVGQYVANLKHGEGVFIWADGKRYEGQYKDNKKWGQGRFIMADGASTEGTFVDGKQHGLFKVTAANGAKLEDTYDMGVKVGK